MQDNSYLYKETINCIPSATLRERLMKEPQELTLMQKATIIEYCADNKTKISLFRRLAEGTQSQDERDLLNSAIADIEKYGYVDTNTQEIYEKKFPHEGAPFFPFLERCFLPQLFKSDDFVKYKGRFFQVQTEPFFRLYTDFSDECYLCFPVDSQGHAHIHICEAERLSDSELEEAKDLLIKKVPR